MKNKEIIEQLRKNAKAEDTIKTLDKWIRLEPDPLFKKKGVFIEWCIERNYTPFPTTVEILEEFLAYLYQQGHSSSGVKQAVGSIDQWHKVNREFPPGQSEQIKSLLHGIVRTIASEGRGIQHSKAAFTIDEIKKVPFKEDVNGIRNKALLLTMFAGGLRKGEAHRMMITHITYTKSGYDLLIPFSKANQTGDFESVSIMKGKDPNWCPVESLKRWLEVSNITEGPVWRRVDRHGRPGVKPLAPYSIYYIVKQAGIQAGFDPDDIGAHSLRSGCATYLLDNGVPDHLVQKHMRHKKFDSTQVYNKNKTSKVLEGVY